MKSKLSVSMLLLVFIILAAVPASSAPLHSTPFHSGTLSAPLRDFVAGPCAPGAAYDPACDVNHDGVVNVLDIQLTAGHFNQTGAFTSDNNHNHLGQTWTGSNNPLKLTGSYGAPDHAPLALSNASGFGLQITSATSTGVFVDSAGDSGVHVRSAGYDGLSVVSADRDGVYVFLAGEHGVYVGSTGDDGFVAGCFGNVTNCFSDPGNANGFEVAKAEDYGVKVVNAGRAAFRSDDSGTNGLYVTTAGDSGVWVADATNWAGFFSGDINVTGNCTGCLIARLAVNSGDETLQPGDVVAVDGVVASPFDSADVLMRVRQATPGSPLLGMVSGRAEPYTSQEDGTTALAPRAGQPAAPGEYLSVVIYGPVQVKAASDVAIGQRVAVDAAGGARALRRVTVEGVTLDEGGSSLGMALDAAKDGLLWVLVNPQ